MNQYKEVFKRRVRLPPKISDDTRILNFNTILVLNDTQYLFDATAKHPWHTKVDNYYTILRLTTCTPLIQKKSLTT